MRNSPMPTIRASVALSYPLWTMLCVLHLGCAEHERAPNYHTSAKSARAAELPPCASPAQGCPCEVPGRLVDCGEVVARTDAYTTCMQGVRMCGDDLVWGQCAGDLVTRAMTPPGDRAVAALGSAVDCTVENPCDPLCRVIADTGTALTNLPEGLCSTASGVQICPLCGYSGPVATVDYATMPAEWRRIPSTCSTADDRCLMDTACLNNACQTRARQCASTDQACAVDLTLGKPCIDGSDNYHIPVCNRGSQALASGTIRIAVDSRSATMVECVPVAATDGTAGYPDAGTISFSLGNGARIEPGTCVDVNSNNSQAEGLNLSDNRAFVVNYDGLVADCNRCNNGSAFIANSPFDTSYCSDCWGLECSSANPATTLRGVVYDPAGVRPLANVLVFVPNGEVADFVDGVACDTCEALVSGEPLVATTTDATGHFTLANMPSDVRFPLVIQIGRWRRQVVVAPIPTGATRWASGRSAQSAEFVLSADASEPVPTEPEWRLRLPRTQRRCVAENCAGEGDIPKMAVIMGDADPLQCTLRRIGIADSEFTSYAAAGRVTPYNAGGMQFPGAISAYGRSSSLLRQDGTSGETALEAFSVLLAPCDISNAEAGSDFAVGATASGPSYNGRPNAAVNWYERASVKGFVDAGGRLLTTHWMGMELAYLNYNPPTRAKFSSSSGATPLDSPFDPSTNLDFSNAVSRYALEAPEFSWQGIAPEEYNPNAPAVLIFGDNVEAASARIHDVSVPVAERWAPLGYDISQQSQLGTTFATWASAVGATAASGVGRLRWREWSPMVRYVRSELGAVPLLVGDSRNAERFEWTDDPSAQKRGSIPQRPCLVGSADEYDCSTGATWGDAHVAMYQFDAPIESDWKCGKVGVTSGHVSQHACFAPHLSRESAYCDQVSSTGLGSPTPDCACLEFPAQADLACGTFEMSEEERAFEFLLFSTSQCIGELAPRHSRSPLPVTTMTRDFEADCASDELVVWELFSWQATVPYGTQIEFYGSTADTQADLGAAPVMAIGIADQTTTTWTAGNHTVDGYFQQQSDPPEVSRRWLRVVARFLPYEGVSPTLAEWRIVFNCKEGL